MDPAKIRLFAGVGGALFGFTGIVALMVALGLYLQPIIGGALAAVTSGAIFLVVGALLMAICLKPMKPAQKELDQFEDATADILADLPFDTIISMVEKRPLAMTGLAAAIGYQLASKDNDVGSKTLQKVMFGLI